MGILEIKFLKWHKWQGRGDLKVPWWFKFSNTFFTGPDLSELTNDEKLIFIFMLCETSKQKKRGKLKLSFDMLKFFLKVDENIIFSALDKLSNIGVLSYIRPESVQIMDGICPESGLQIRLDEIRIEKIREEKKNLNPAKGKKEKQEIKIGKPILAPSLVWESYRISYQNKYNVDPVRNSMVNAQIKQLVNRVGEENAIELVKFYLAHKDSFYSLKLHPIGLCLKDCEGLLTQMRSGVSVTKAGFKNQENQNWYKEQMERMSVDKE